MNNPLGSFMVRDNKVPGGNLLCRLNKGVWDGQCLLLDLIQAWKNGLLVVPFGNQRLERLQVATPLHSSAPLLFQCQEMAKNFSIDNDFYYVPVTAHFLHTRSLARSFSLSWLRQLREVIKVENKYFTWTLLLLHWFHPDALLLLTGLCQPPSPLLGWQPESFQQTDETRFTIYGNAPSG